MKKRQLNLSLLVDLTERELEGVIEETVEGNQALKTENFVFELYLKKRGVDLEGPLQEDRESVDGTDGVSRSADAGRVVLPLVLKAEILKKVSGDYKAIVGDLIRRYREARDDEVTSVLESEAYIEALAAAVKAWETNSSARESAAEFIKMLRGLTKAAEQKLRDVGVHFKLMRARNARLTKHLRKVASLKEFVLPGDLYFHRHMNECLEVEYDQVSWGLREGKFLTTYIAEENCRLTKQLRLREGLRTAVRTLAARDIWEAGRGTTAMQDRVTAANRLAAALSPVKRRLRREGFVYAPPVEEYRAQRLAYVDLFGRLKKVRKDIASLDLLLKTTTPPFRPRLLSQAPKQSSRKLTLL